MYNTSLSHGATVVDGWDLFCFQTPLCSQIETFDTDEIKNKQFATVKEESDLTKMLSIMKYLTMTLCSESSVFVLSVFIFMDSSPSHHSSLHMFPICCSHHCH